MLIVSICDAYWWEGFAIGIVAGGVLTFFSLLLSALHDDKKKECAEFEKCKKQRHQRPTATKVINAQFVVTPKPKLSSSTALVKRTTSLERRSL